MKRYFQRGKTVMIKPEGEIRTSLLQKHTCIILAFMDSINTRLSYSFHKYSLTISADNILQQNEVEDNMKFSRKKPFFVLIKSYTFNLLLKYAQVFYKAHEKLKFSNSMKT